MAARQDRGLVRILEKLHTSVTTGQYYEAHQMYRTLYFRYLSQKKYDELLNLLYKGSTILLEHDQQGSGTDLAILLVDVLNQSKTRPNTEWIEYVGKLFSLMNANIPERETFLTMAVKWSMDENDRGHPLLHKKIAEVFWKEKKYTAAHKHFLRSNDGSTYAAMLIELHTNYGFKSEVDLTIAQAVLQILCLQNLQMAMETFNKYTALHPTIKNDKGPPYLFPLLNFLWFLLRAIEQHKIAQFKFLREWYAISLKRDSNYSIYMDNIGRIWFGIEIPKTRKNPRGMFGGFLSSVFRDTGSSDEEPEAGGSMAALDLD